MRRNPFSAICRTSAVAAVALLLVAAIGGAGIGNETSESVSKASGKAEDATREEIEKRVGYDIEYLASDELEGRGVETEGIAIAADYIRDEFKKYGLASGTEDGTYFQPFEVPLGDTVSEEDCQLVLTGPDGQTIELEINESYIPQQIGGSGEVSAELVFVGYGINAPDLDYQEYADVDVEGKIVVMLRHEPGQKDPESKFEGEDPSGHSYIVTKVTAARVAKAAGIILVNDPISTPMGEDDELTPAGQFGNRSLNVPFAHVKQDVMAKVLGATPIKDSEGNELSSLAQVQDTLDKTLKPLSQALTGWKAELVTSFKSRSVETDNVIAVIEGEGPHADETIVIGGHYDHLGFGGYGSRAPGRNEVHYGADDNATGTAAVMELARRFAQRDEKPSRRLVFVAFSGEERGLIGAAYYCNNPPFALDKTVAMINFDMIGRLRNRSVTLFGVPTSESFAGAVERAADGLDFNLTIPTAGFAGSDHVPFIRNQIPAVFFHTGLTDVYHTPEDSFETINVPGAVDVIDLSERFVAELLELEESPTFTQPAPRQPRRRVAYLGAQPDFGASDEGIYLREINDDSPADKAGLKVGDILLKIGDDEIANQQDLLAALRKNEAGEEVELTIKRDEETIQVKVTLDRTPRRTRNRD